MLSDAALQRYLDENPVKDEELKPTYDKGVAELPPRYHTRQILVDNPGTAAELITKIKGGADFAKLAKAQSIDTSKDSGWQELQDMVPEYAVAVQKLKVGEMTQEPVRSSFGWHVIKLEETKPQDVKPFEEVKDKVVLLVKRQRIEAYLASLREQAKIDKEQRAPKK